MGRSQGTSAAGDVIDPADWPPSGNVQPARRSVAKSAAKNGLRFAPGQRGNGVAPPRRINFKERATISVNGQRIKGDNQIIKPGHRPALLEDVRTLGDRQHPFWARVECPTGRFHAE